MKFSSQFLKKSSYIKFHENLYGGSQTVPCRWTDMTKLLVAFCNFADAPNKMQVLPCHSHYHCNKYHVTISLMLVEVNYKNKQKKNFL